MTITKAATEASKPEKAKQYYHLGLDYSIVDNDDEEEDVDVVVVGDEQQLRAEVGGEARPGFVTRITTAGGTGGGEREGKSLAEELAEASNKENQGAGKIDHGCGGSSSPFIVSNRLHDGEFQLEEDLFPADDGHSGNNVAAAAAHMVIRSELAVPKVGRGALPSPGQAGWSGSKKIILHSVGGQLPGGSQLPYYGCGPQCCVLS